METKTITIQSVKFAPTKTGKDKWLIETDAGNMSVWDGKLAEVLHKRNGERVSAEIRPPLEGSNYNPTITDVNDASDETVEGFAKPVERTEPLVSTVQEEPRKSVKGSAYEKDPVGLAVEVFNVIYVAILKDQTAGKVIMDEAIALVKQAQEAFK